MKEGKGVGRSLFGRVGGIGVKAQFLPDRMGAEFLDGQVERLGNFFDTLVGTGIEKHFEPLLRGEWLGFRFFGFHGVGWSVFGFTEILAARQAAGVWPCEGPLGEIPFPALAAASSFEYASFPARSRSPKTKQHFLKRFSDMAIFPFSTACSVDFAQPRCRAKNDRVIPNSIRSVRIWPESFRRCRFFVVFSDMVFFTNKAFMRQTLKYAVGITRCLSNI
jgi:hypothetical protein